MVATQVFRDPLSLSSTTLHYLATVRRAILALALVMAGVTWWPSRGGGDASPSPFLLIIGGSTSLGWQPLGASTKRASPTDDGYQAMLVAFAALNGETFEVHNLACTGATARGMYLPRRRLRSDNCYPPPSSQLSAALNFLKVNSTRPGIVIMDLGQNLLHQCMWTSAMSDSCFASALTDDKVYLPKVAHDVMSVAGPQVDVVGLNFYDPYVARPLTSTSVTWTQERHLHTYFTQANQFVGNAYGASHVPVVDLASAFGSDNWDPVPFGGTTIPSNAFHASQLTWMCYSAPFGPDPHPNRAGYIVIADAILQTLAPPWNEHPLGWANPLAPP